MGGVHLKKYVCPTCGKLFLHRSPMIAHIRTHKREEEHKNFPCTKCPKLFKTKKYLKKHILNVHEGPKEIQVEENTETIDDSKENNHLTKRLRKFVCPTCGKSFLKSYNLKLH